MKTLYKAAILFLPLLVLFVVHPFQRTNAQQASVSPTPTYDPFAEPALPPDPTEYELGRNLYWHWCMPCHGDRGQGLTDEFRGIWPPDHQNCWGRGCHVGRREDTGFPIPTTVPGLVNENQLGHFSSLQELDDYLKATHPPQSPGILKSEEYHAIAVFVFTLNGRLLINTSSTATPVTTPTATLVPAQKSTPSPYLLPVAAIALLALVFVLIRGVRGQEKNGTD